MDSVTLFRRQVLLDRLGFKKSKLHAMVAAGQFPQPVKIGRASAWRSDDVQRWVDALPKSGMARP